MRISDWSSDVCSSDLDSRTGAIFEERLQPIEQILDVLGMDLEFLGPGKQDELRSQADAAANSFMRRDEGRFVAIALGEAQPGLDDREDVPEIVRQARVSQIGRAHV